MCRLFAEYDGFQTGDVGVASCRDPEQYPTAVIATWNENRPLMVFQSTKIPTFMQAELLLRRLRLLLLESRQTVQAPFLEMMRMMEMQVSKVDIGKRLETTAPCTPPSKMLLMKNTCQVRLME